MLAKDVKYEAKRRNDPDLLERKRASRRRHHAANAERLNDARADRQRANPEPGRAARKRYLQTDKGRDARWRVENSPRQRARHAENVRRRRARLAGVPSERIDIAVLRARSDGRCGICDELLIGVVEVDHVVPIAHGGTHTYENVQLAHPICNRRKGARLMEEVT